MYLVYYYQAPKALKTKLEKDQVSNVGSFLERLWLNSFILDLGRYWFNRKSSFFLNVRSQNF